MTMNRPAWLRLSVLTALFLPAAIIFGVALEAQGQMQFERIWRCSKCGGNLGNGVQAPPSCPHCGIKLRSARDNNWYGPPQKPAAGRGSGSGRESSPWATSAVVALVILGAVGLGIVVMNSGGGAS